MADSTVTGVELDRALDRARTRPAGARGRFSLGVGAVLVDGHTPVRVVGCERDARGQLEMLLEHDGRTHRIPYTKLCATSTRLAPHDPATSADDLPTDPQWEALPAGEQQAVIAVARHLRQVQTGSPDGNLERAITLGRVDPRYDPRLVPDLEARIHAKSEELTAAGIAGASVPSLKRKLARFRTHGVMGLVDQRWLRRGDVLADLDPAVAACISAVIAARLAQSTTSTRTLIALGRAELARAGLGAELSPARLRAVVGELTRGRAMHRAARSRRTHTNRPSGVYGRLHASRPGEIVQIDATPANAHVWSPDTGWCPATILTAIDVYSRQILALRVVPGAVSTRDTSLLLWDICQAEVIRGGWPRQLHRWHGMPVLVVIDPDQTRLPHERPAKSDPDRVLGVKRAVVSSTVVIDHGGEFDAEHFLSVCARNGTDVIFARPQTPTDKGIVEAWHRTLDEAIRILPGYKGANPQDHPAGAEDDAALTCADLQDMLWTWILTIYHDTPHEGLRDLANPRVKISPNLAFDRFIQAGGHIEVPNDPYRLISFLSCQSNATIQSDGIQLQRRVFVNDRVIELGHRLQRGKGAKTRTVPVYYDRWDMARIYLFDPFEKTWLCVPAASPGGTAVAPFSEAITRAAIADTVHGAPVVSDDGLHHREQQLLAAFASGVFADRRERRLHALEEARQTALAAEIETWSDEMRALAFPPTPAPADEPGLIGYGDADQDDAEIFAYDPDDTDGLAL